MPTALTTAEEIRFPDRCARCGGKPETTHQLEASRGIDLIFIAAFEFIHVPVPVCTSCKWSRRWRGVAVYGGGLLFIIASMVGASAAYQAGHPAIMTVLLVLLGIVVLALRFRGKHLLESTTFGFDIDLLKGDELPLRIRFRRPEAFNAWRAANPRATTSAAGSPVGSRA